MQETWHHHAKNMAPPCKKHGISMQKHGGKNKIQPCKKHGTVMKKKNSTSMRHAKNMAPPCKKTWHRHKKNMAPPQKKHGTTMKKTWHHHKKTWKGQKKVRGGLFTRVAHWNNFLAIRSWTEIFTGDNNQYMYLLKKISNLSVYPLGAHNSEISARLISNFTLFFEVKIENTTI